MLVVEVLHEAQGETRQITLVPEGAIFGLGLLVKLNRVLEKSDEGHRGTQPFLVLSCVYVSELQGFEELIVQLLQESSQARHGRVPGIHGLRRGPLVLVLVLVLLVSLVV